MRSLALLAILCAAFVNLGLAQNGIKILEEPAVKEIAEYTAATTITKAADFAPEEGYGETPEDYNMAYQAMMMNGFETLTGWMNETRQPAGPMFCIYFEDPRETKPAELTSKQGFPVAGDPDPAPGVVIEKVPAHKVVSIKYGGNYKESETAWNALMEYGEKNDLTWAGAPMEIYHVSMGDTENPEEWVTEIQWPVMTADDMKEMEQMEEESDSENGEG